MATRISKSIVQESYIVFERIIYWPDSLSTLYLIRNSTRRFCDFVDTRHAEICDSSLVLEWRYCPSMRNPTDIGTRVITPKNTKKFSPWFKGPSFLLLPENNWPEMPLEKNQIVDVTSLFINRHEIKAEPTSKALPPFEKFLTLIN